MAGRAYFSHQCCICCNGYLQISKEVVVSGAAIRDLRLVRGSKLQAAFRPAWHAFVPLFLSLSPHDKKWFLKIWILHAMMDVVVQREFDAIAPRMHMSRLRILTMVKCNFIFVGSIPCIVLRAQDAGSIYVGSFSRSVFHFWENGKSVTLILAHS